jgi:hypothetical protein
MMRVTTNAGLVAAELAAMGSPALQGDLERITRRSGADLRKAVQAHAPKQTGRYRRSWRTRTLTFPLSNRVTAYVGTDEPYGYRLEAGDAERPPQPHVEPALAEVGPVFVAQVEGAVRVWMAGKLRT